MYPSRSPHQWKGNFASSEYSSASSWMFLKMRCSLPRLKFSAGLYGNHVGGVVKGGRKGGAPGLKDGGSQYEPNWRLSGWSSSAVLCATLQSTSGAPKPRKVEPPGPPSPSWWVPSTCSMLVLRCV